MPTPKLTTKVTRLSEAMLMMLERAELSPEEKLNVVQLLAVRLVLIGRGDLRELLEATADELAVGVRGIGGRLLDQMEKRPAAGRA